MALHVVMLFHRQLSRKKQSTQNTTMIVFSLGILLVFLTATSATTNPPRAHQLDETYTFSQYLSHFSKSYPNPEEYAHRSATFYANLQRILEHNQGRMDGFGKVVKGYVMGVNRFTDLEVHELPMGYNKAHRAWREREEGLATATERRLGGTQSYSKPPQFEMEEVADLPESVDWSEKINPAPAQGGCGDCWAFAATACVESQLAIATGEDPVKLSETNMFECSPNPQQCGGTGKCEGSTAELGWNYIADLTAKKLGGMYLLDDLPYTSFDEECEGLADNLTPVVGVEGWTSLPSNDYKATMNAVAKVGPLALAVAASEWASYESGVFSSDDSVVNHAVVLAGYGVDEDTNEKYYLIRNSWGEDFGENGYIRVKRTDDDSTNCKEDKDPLVGVACALDENGESLSVQPATVCGDSAVLFDVSYPLLDLTSRDDNLRQLKGCKNNGIMFVFGLGILLLLLSLTATSATTDHPPRAHQLDETYTFSQYLSHFSKSYPNPVEYARRSAIFYANLRKIMEHNQGRMDEFGKVLKGYVKGVNRFTDLEMHELPMGYNKAHRAWREKEEGLVKATERMLGGKQFYYSKPPDFEMEEVADLPESVDWSDKVNPAPNQGVCGACWAFAATACVESQLAIATGEDPVKLSETNMLQCAPNPQQCGGTGKCEGSTPELGMNYIADLTAKKLGGMYLLDDLPYISYGGNCEGLTDNLTPVVGIEAWTSLPSNDYKATMNAVAKVGPLALAVAAGEWASYESGVFSSDESVVNHGVVLAGYGVDEDTNEKYYLIRNSWGEDFGENGYIRVKRTDDDSTNCKEDKDPLVGVACALDENGESLSVQPATVCGDSAVLFDVSYPVGAHKL
eukprot:CCRYP_014367-RC/>CCRYP_014367-RC protein AED:0.13 eAED:0.13 QI:57/0.85/0.75/1/0.85/0.75/8/132/854